MIIIKHLQNIRLSQFYIVFSIIKKLPIKERLKTKVQNILDSIVNSPEFCNNGLLRKCNRQPISAKWRSTFKKIHLTYQTFVRNYKCGLDIRAECALYLKAILRQTTHIPQITYLANASKYIKCNMFFQNGIFNLIQRVSLKIILNNFKLY